jgi:hypothetical protein
LVVHGIRRQAVGSEEQSPRFFIDVSWFEENGLNFDSIARARLCSSCRAKEPGQAPEAPAQPEPRRSGRMAQLYSGRLAAFKSRPENDPIKMIRECCSKKATYIDQDMPTLEVLFRIYLANGNQPMPLEHVREQMADYCPSGGCQWLVVPVETLLRLVQADRYYGIRPHTLPASM